MLRFRRLPPGTRSRFQALRDLYRSGRSESTRDRQARGLRLLRDWLSRCQREQFDAEGHFDVIGCDTGRRYRIYYGTAMNVHEIDAAGHLKMGWCFIPSGSLVAGDVMLAQKIGLEAFECSALADANRFVPGGPVRRPEVSNRSPGNPGHCTGTAGSTRKQSDHPAP